MLQRIKYFITEQAGLPPIAVLIGIGLAAHLALNAVCHKSPLSPRGLVAPLALGICLEGYEIWAQYRSIGLFAPGNDSVLIILVRHSVDMIALLILPVVLVLAGLYSKR